MVITKNMFHLKDGTRVFVVPGSALDSEVIINFDDEDFIRIDAFDIITNSTVGFQKNGNQYYIPKYGITIRLTDDYVEIKEEDKIYKAIAWE